MNILNIITKFALLVAMLFSTSLLCAADAPPAKRSGGRVQTPPPTHPPLQLVEITQRSGNAQRIDLFLLVGQSNMKGRGFMPDQPSRDRRIVMMHLKDDPWYVARHPIHLKGDAKTFRGADNAGVGPGLAFAEALIARNPDVRLGLIPCAVGGSSINLWQKDAKLYDEAIRRARLALRTTEPVHGTIRGVLWLQGEADATEERLPVHEDRLLRMIDNLRADLGDPALPFIACTIGEMRPDESQLTQQMNTGLLSLPSKCPNTGCVDARDLTTHIGDLVHFDTAAQNAIGRRFALQFVKLTEKK